MTEYEHMEMNPISPARDGCFFSLSLSPALSPSRLSATLNNSLTVRADLAHQLTDKYLKRKAVRWEQSALFTSQANTPLVCVMVVVGAVGGGGGVDEGGRGWLSRLYSSDAHICSVYQTLERTQASSLIHLPTRATQMSPQLVSRAADETLQPRATLNLIPLWACVKSQWASRESNRLNMMWSLLSGDYKVSNSHSHHGCQK